MKSIVKVAALASIVLAGFLADQAQAAFADGSLRVCVFYDNPKADPNYKLGRVYSVMLQNLLGHFREVRPVEFDVSTYKEGQLSSCDRAAYLGTHFSSEIPEAFYKDVIASDRPFFWVNYSIWNLQRYMGAEPFEQRFGFRFQKLEWSTPATPEELARKEVPAFFQNIHYKGEVFRKFAKFDYTKGLFAISPEIARISVSNAQILAEAEHTRTHERTPYLVRHKNFFFVGDVPLSFIHENDRYLIFSDVLFDFLGLPPRLNKKLAFVRAEDIHAAMNPEYMNRMVSVFKRRNIPFGMTLIPRYVDVWGMWDGDRHDIKLYQAPLFMKALKRAMDARGRVIFHGYTHQFGHEVNCDSGASGDDFEFWDDCARAPMPWDSENYVNSRIQKGREIFAAAGVPLYAWVPPHYQASPLAYRIFAKTFKVSIQRVRYVPDGVDPADTINWAGQFFPYVIEKDYYGQYILPENMGNVRHNRGDVKDFNAQTEEELIEAAKKNLVIRDAWASFFFHPFLVGDKKVRLDTLERILDAMLAMGYEFVDLKDFQR